MTPMRIACDDDIIFCYRSTGSIRATASKYNICTQTVRRVLITHGVPLKRGEAAMRIITMLKTMPPEDVAAHFDCSVKTVKAYMPYTKGSYVVGEKSVNAKRIAKSRQRKKEGMHID